MATAEQRTKRVALWLIDKTVLNAPDVNGSVCQDWAVTPGIERLLAYKMLQQMPAQSAHLCRSNSRPLRLRCVTWIKMEGVKSGRSNAVKPGKLGFSYKACKCNDAGTGASVCHHAL